MSTFDFDAAVRAPFRMQPGLRRLAGGAQQLHPLEPGSPVFDEKLAALRAAPGDAVCMVDDFDATASLDALAAEAARQCPCAVVRDPQAGVTAPALGWRVDAHGELHPAGGTRHGGAGDGLERLPARLRLAGLLALALHEDFALVDGVSATLPLLAVCLPSHWSPRAKLGQAFDAVHAPVPEGAAVRAAGDGLLQLACGAQRWERFVWTITSLAGHDAHPLRKPRPPWASGDDVVAQARWRTERQSFVPLPERRQAWFLIEVRVAPLTVAVDTAARASALHAALASMSPAVLDYRSLSAARAPLLRWLEARAATA